MPRLVLPTARTAPTALAALAVLALLLLHCGARTPLEGTATTTAPGACAPPQCSDNTRGTWRLESAQHEPLGYFYTFDGRGTCNGSSTNFLLMLGPSDASCSRNGDYTISEDTSSGLVGTADGMGGSFSEACGGADPFPETLSFALLRMGCDPSVYRLTIHDSDPGSVYETTAVATRCRCDLAWEPCAEATPDDPCAP